MATNVRRTDRHPAQYLALVVGVVYTVVGIAGFFLTGFDGLAAPEGELLLGVFEINPLHNIVHLVIGLAGIAMWSPLGRARAYGWLLAVGYGLAFIYGLFVAGTNTPENFLALNMPDNWLHLGSALVGLAIALWPARDRRTAERAPGTTAAADHGAPDDLRVEHRDRDRARRGR